jgi:DNA-binding Lrp family transcriptional regulator
MHCAVAHIDQVLVRGGPRGLDTAALVYRRIHDGRAGLHLQKAVARVPDMLECYLMAGTADYLLKIVTENTEDFAGIHRQYLSRLPGVTQMPPSFVLRTVVQTTSRPV